MSSPHTAESTPKYQRVFDALREEIASGKYEPGQKLPSEAALVNRFHTSRITVGRAVGDLQRAGLVERRAGSGTYVHASRVESLSFGMIVPELDDTEIFDAICRGMADSPKVRDHALVWCRAREASVSPQERAWQICRQYIERKVSGVFFAPSEIVNPEDADRGRIAAALDRAGIPLVLLDCDFLPYPRRSAYDLVGIDNRRTGFAATEHLLQLGARRIVFVTPPRRPATVEARIAGYREGLRQRGLPMEVAQVRDIPGGDDEGVRSMLRELEPDAFLCANDRAAGCLMQSLLRLGVRIPGDVRIVGIDDTPYASFLPVPLTTMRQPCRQMGATAISAMMERLERPEMAARDILLDCPLVIRDSCGGKR